MAPGPPGGNPQGNPGNRVAQESGKLNTVQTGADQPCPYGDGSVTSRRAAQGVPAVEEECPPWRTWGQGWALGATEGGQRGTGPGEEMGSRAWGALRSRPAG